MSVVGAVVPFLLPLFVYAVWSGHVDPPLTGDEACYLVQARSLAQDLDLDLEDDFSDPTGIATYAPDTAGDAGCAADFLGNGKLHTWFSPGVGLMVAPLARVTFGLRFLRLGMVALGAVLAQQLLGLLTDVGIGPPGARHAVWAGTVFLLPLLGFSNQFYPEIPAALLCVIAARLLLRARVGPKFPAWATVAVAFLPWLHLRFALIAAVVTAMAAVAASKSPGQPDGSAILRGVLRRWYYAVPLGASVLCLLVLYRRLYGSFWPTAPYRSGGAALMHLTPLQVYRIGVGSLFGPSAGLIPHNPFLWLGLAGLIPFARRFGATGWAWVALFLAQVFLVDPMGFFGYSLPGRFLVVAVPLLAVAALCAIESSRVLRPVGTALALSGILVAAEGYNHYGKLLDIGRPQALPARIAGPVWPTTENLPGLTDYGYRPDGLRRSVGRLETLPDGSTVAASVSNDGPGVLVEAPPVELRQGAWLIRVAVSTEGPPAEHAGSVTVSLLDHGTVIADRPFSFGETAPRAVGGFREIAVPVLAPMDAVYVTIDVTGTGAVRVAWIAGRPSAPLLDPAAPVRRTIPLGLFWLGITVLVGFLLPADRWSSPSLRSRGSPPPTL